MTQYCHTRGKISQSIYQSLNSVFPVDVIATTRLPFEMKKPKQAKTITSANLDLCFHKLKASFKSSSEIQISLSPDTSDMKSLSSSGKKHGDENTQHTGCC